MTDDPQISDREREILRLVATGATNQQIAQQLNISVNTVKVHLRNIFGKLNVVSRTEATLYAVRTGLVSVERAGATASPLHSDPASEAILVAPEPIEPAEATDLIAAEPDIEPPALTSTAPVDEPATERPTAVGASHPVTHLNWPAIAMAVIALVAVGVVIYLLTVDRAGSGQATDTNDPELADPNQRWRDLAPLPEPRASFGLAMATVERDTFFYAIGGEDTQVRDTVLIYGLKTNSWDRGRAKPTAVSDVQAITIGGRIYVPGGRGADGRPVRIFEAYDPQRDAWIPLADLPEPRSRYALASVDGKLYLIGGWDGQSYRGEVWQYSPDSDSWDERVGMPAPSADAGAAVIDGQIYVIGGENQSGLLNLTQRYNPAEEDQGTAWINVALLPTARSAMGTAALSDRLFALSGAGSDGGAIYYSPGSDRWQSVDTRLDSPLRGLRSIALGNNKIYIFGGSDDSGPRGNVFEYRALYTVVVPIS